MTYREGYIGDITAIINDHPIRFSTIIPASRIIEVENLLYLFEYPFIQFLWDNRGNKNTVHQLYDIFITHTDFYPLEQETSIAQIVYDSHSFFGNVEDDGEICEGCIDISDQEDYYDSTFNDDLGGYIYTCRGAQHRFMSHTPKELNTLVDLISLETNICDLVSKEITRKAFDKIVTPYIAGVVADALTEKLSDALVLQYSVNIFAI